MLSATVINTESFQFHKKQISTAVMNYYMVWPNEQNSIEKMMSYVIFLQFHYGNQCIYH